MDLRPTLPRAYYSRAEVESLLLAMAEATGVAIGGLRLMIESAEGGLPVARGVIHRARGAHAVAVRTLRRLVPPGPGMPDLAGMELPEAGGQDRHGGRDAPPSP